MKNLLFICGPNGIGKTTICKEIIKQLPNSAYVDSDSCRMMNPFMLDDTTIPTISKNISDLIANYFNCTSVHSVVFSYGFHGRRKEVFQNVLSQIADIEYHFIPFLLWCNEEENIKRMTSDDRSPDRIQKAITESRKAFDDITYPKIDISDFSAYESALEIINKVKLYV